MNTQKDKATPYEQLMASTMSISEKQQYLADAFNSHDALLEACKEAKKKLEGIEYDKASAEVKSAFDVLSQAINQAESK